GKDDRARARETFARASRPSRSAARALTTRSASASNSRAAARRAVFVAVSHEDLARAAAGRASVVASASVAAHATAAAEETEADDERSADDAEETAARRVVGRLRRRELRAVARRSGRSLRSSSDR